MMACRTGLVDLPDAAKAVGRKPIRSRDRSLREAGALNEVAALNKEE
jgi:hypothetical protein